MAVCDVTQPTNGAHKIPANTTDASELRVMWSNRPQVGTCSGGRRNVGERVNHKEHAKEFCGLAIYTFYTSLFVTLELPQCSLSRSASELPQRSTLCLIRSQTSSGGALRVALAPSSINQRGRMFSGCLERRLGLVEHGAADISWATRAALVALTPGCKSS